MLSTEKGALKMHLDVMIYKMVLEPNVSPHKQIIKDDDVKECISIK